MLNNKYAEYLQQWENTPPNIRKEVSLKRHALWDILRSIFSDAHLLEVNLRDRENNFIYHAKIEQVP